MPGYKSNDKFASPEAVVPDCACQRNQAVSDQVITEHGKKLAVIKDQLQTAKETLESIEKAIPVKQAEFDAMVLENNAKLQGIQREIRGAGEALEREKVAFKEWEATIREDLKTRQAVLLNKETDCAALGKRQHDQIVVLNTQARQLEGIKIELATRSADINIAEAAAKKLTHEAEALSKVNKDEAIRLEEKSEVLNNESTLVDTRRVHNAGESDRIKKEATALQDLIKKAEVTTAEYERVQKLAADTEKQIKTFNEQRDWLANKQAELQTYERALRVRDAQITEREGKVQTAEKKIGGTEE